MLPPLPSCSHTSQESGMILCRLPSTMCLHLQRYLSTHLRLPSNRSHHCLIPTQLLHQITRLLHLHPHLHCRLLCQSHPLNLSHHPNKPFLPTRARHCRCSFKRPLTQSSCNHLDVLRESLVKRGETMSVPLSSLRHSVTLVVPCAFLTTSYFSLSYAVTHFNFSAWQRSPVHSSKLIANSSLSPLVESGSKTVFHSVYRCTVPNASLGCLTTSSQPSHIHQPRPVFIVKHC